MVAIGQDLSELCELKSVEEPPVDELMTPGTCQIGSRAASMSGSFSIQAWYGQELQLSTPGLVPEYHRSAKHVEATLGKLPAQSRRHRVHGSDVYCTWSMFGRDYAVRGCPVHQDLVTNVMDLSDSEKRNKSCLYEQEALLDG
eukprot:Skav229185  [mRNA]  locus=scaffold1004:299923:302864:- [translate_table: standard]